LIVRLARIFVKTLLGLLVLAVVVIAGLLYFPQLAEERAQLAANILGRLIDRHVVIAGDADFSLGPSTTVTLSKVAIDETEGEDRKERIDLAKVAFTFPLGDAIAGRFRPTDVAISGMRFEQSAAPTDADSGDEDLVTGWFIEWLLDKDRTPKITLQDILLVRKDDPDGWNSEIDFKQVNVVRREAGLKLDATGKFGDAPFDISAVFSAPGDASEGKAERTVTLSATVPGAVVDIKGKVDSTKEDVDLELKVSSKSLGDLLETLRLNRETDGIGEFKLQIAGPVYALAAHDISLDLTLTGGERSIVTGAIDKLSMGAGIDLDVSMDFPKGDDVGGHVTSALDIELRGLKGRVIGGVTGLKITEMTLATNIASAELQNIGPISAKKIVRDDDGRLGLLGLKLIEGDPSKPALDLEGDFRDVIGLSGISVAGKFDIDAIELFSRRKNSSGNPRLQGELAISDASGVLSIVKLAARTSKNAAFKLALDKSSADAPIGIDFATSDLDALAAIMGAKPIGGGPAFFKGQISAGKDIRTKGKAEIGQTKFSLNLRGDITKGTPYLSGSIDASVLKLSDLKRASGLAGVFKVQPAETKVKITLKNTFHAELDLLAQKISGVEGSANKFKAHLSYKGQKAVFSPLQLDLLGGKLDAKLIVATDRKAPSAAFSGEMHRMDLATLLAQLDAKPLVAGQLNAKFDLKSGGSTIGGNVKALSGSIHASLRNGVIGTDLIDLTGMDVVSWLFTESGKGKTRIACAVTSVAFKSGRGAFESLVIETDNVQIVGKGDINLRDDTLKIDFQPHPLQKQLLEVATPFTVSGSLKSPKVSVTHGGALVARGVTETVGLPLHLLGLLTKHNEPDKKSSSSGCKLATGSAKK
jgi:hypothetical protein